MVSKILFGSILLISFVYGFPSHGKMHPPPCGVPPFVESLPEEAQEKINNIWRDYKEGDKCYEEQGLTREVIDGLPKDVKKNIHRRPHLPFLKGLSKEVVAKFDAIFKDKSIPREEKHAKIDELAEKELTGDNLKKFKEFKEKKEKQDMEYKEKESKLSDAAKKANEKLEELEKKKHEILEELSEDQRAELFELWKTRPHFGRGPPRHHH